MRSTFEKSVLVFNNRCFSLKTVTSRKPAVREHSENTKSDYRVESNTKLLVEEYYKAKGVASKILPSERDLYDKSEVYQHLLAYFEYQNLIDLTNRKFICIDSVLSTLTKSPLETKLT